MMSPKLNSNTVQGMNFAIILKNRNVAINTFLPLYKLAILDLVW
jgi:hypothetical protein